MTAPGREQDLGFESPAQSSGRPAVRRGKQCSRRDQVHAHAVPTGAQNWKFCAGSRQAVSAAASRAESAIRRRTGTTTESRSVIGAGRSGVRN